MSYGPRRIAASFLALSLPMPAAAVAKTPVVGTTTRQHRTVPAFPPDVKARGDRLWNAASPAVKAWANQYAPAVARGTGDPNALVASAIQTRWSSLRKEHARVQSEAPDTLAFILNYEAAKILQAELKNDLDSRGDQTQLMQQRLQNYLERYTKCFEVLSIILRKMSDTSDGIVRNLK